MTQAPEDPFEAFKKKKADEEERKRQDALLAEQQEAEAEAARKIAEEQASVLEEDADEGDEARERPLIVTRMLRKASKKGEVKDTEKPSGFDDHRFEGTKPGEDVDEEERPEGMQTDRFD